jgi:hypothetical protein
MGTTYSSVEFLTCVQEEFGECGRPRVGWQIDPFGHAREHAHIMAKVFRYLFKDCKWKHYRYRAARLDQPQTGIIGKAFKKTSTAIGFLFFYFDLEFLKKFQNSEPLHTKCI